MVKKKPIEVTQNSLQKSFERISTILKAMGQENRLKILIMLLSEPRTFQTLCDETDLKNTALSNHLTKLRAAMLIEKMQHGLYKITEDGLKFLEAIETTYEESKVREIEEKGALQKYQLTETFLHRKKQHET